MERGYRHVSHTGASCRAAENSESESERRLSYVYDARAIFLRYHGLSEREIHGLTCRISIDTSHDRQR